MYTIPIANYASLSNLCRVSHGMAHELTFEKEVLDGGTEESQSSCRVNLDNAWECCNFCASSFSSRGAAFFQKPNERDERVIGFLSSSYLHDCIIQRFRQSATAIVSSNSVSVCRCQFKLFVSLSLDLSIWQVIIKVFLLPPILSKSSSCVSSVDNSNAFRASNIRLPNCRKQQSWQILPSPC